MGIAHAVLPDLGLTIIVWHGVVSMQDTIDNLLTLAADSEWPPGRRTLTDLTTVSRVTMPDPQLLEVLLEGTDLPQSPAKAVLVRPEFLGGTGIQDAAASLGLSATPFTDLAPACAFLDVDDCGRVRTAIDDLRVRLRTRP